MDGPPPVVPEAGQFSILYTPDPDDPNMTLLYSTTELDTGHTIHWDMGDGTKVDALAGTDCPHTYAEAGDYDVSARCHGITETVTVTITPPDEPIIVPLTLTLITPAFADWWTKNGQTFVLQGDGFHDGVNVRFRNMYSGADVTFPLDLSEPPSATAGSVTIPPGYPAVGNDIVTMWLQSDTQESNSMTVCTTTQTINNTGARKIDLFLFNVKSQQAYQIDWGDGSKTNTSTNARGDTNRPHTYAALGNYTITIREGTTGPVVYTFPISVATELADEPSAWPSELPEGWTPDP
jgi:hypothetical protein